jgi:hypothetical protein
MTKQLGRAWRLGRDLVGVLRGLARTLAWAFRAPVARPALALLEGAPCTRLGTPSNYRVRAYNPCSVPRSLRVLVVGWVDGTPDARFQLEWDAILEPGAVSERWIRTDWRGTASIVDRSPGDAPIWNAGDRIGRWHIEARLAERTVPTLQVSGALVG